MSFAQVKSWRGGRAVECGGLEIRYGCKIIVGSNPTLSVENPHSRDMAVPFPHSRDTAVPFPYDRTSRISRTWYVLWEILGKIWGR